MPVQKSLLSRDSLRKLSPGVFEHAAANILRGYDTYSCHAIESGAYHYCSQYNDESYKDAFFEAFGPKPGTPWRVTHNGMDQPKGHPFWNRSKTPERQNDRYTALLMMAAMVRSAKASRGAKKQKPVDFFWPFRDASGGMI